MIEWRNEVVYNICAKHCLHRRNKVESRQVKDMDMKRSNINKAFLICLFLGYLIFNIILLMKHEPWRDEANVWLLARELTPVELFREIKYQGHPCLWYLLVMPFAKAGFPFRTIEVLSFLIMATTAALFLHKAPIHSITKAFCLFSPIFTYFYSCIARNYCLIALLLICLAWQFPKRNEKSVLYGCLLGLLVQADTIALVPAGLISSMWLCENAWYSIQEKNLQKMKALLKGIWIPLISLFLWIIQFYQVSDSPQFHTRNLVLFEFLTEVKNFLYAIFIRITGWNQKLCLLFLLLCMIAFVILSLKLRNGWAMCVIMISVLFQAVFSAVVYQLHIWHYISLCFVFIWTIWILYYQIKNKQITGLTGDVTVGILEFLLITLCLGMFLHWNSEAEVSSLNNALNGVYSDGKNTAEFIKENISPEEVFVSADIPMASTVLAYLPEYDFYFAGNGQKATYADWSETQSTAISFEGLKIWAKEQFPNKKEFYLLWMEDSRLTDADGLRNCEILYQTLGKTVRGEEYTIFRITL